MLQMLKLKELSFLVYGLGLSGHSVIRFFKKNKIKNFKVWDDDKKKLIKEYKPKNLYQTFKEVDYIILAPGISLLKNNYLKKFKRKIITDIDLFYLTKTIFKSIVVTGTNGKSTTCKLLAHLLKKNKFNVSLGGNIGTPVLDLKSLKKNYVIIEASSFQLSHSRFIRPDYAFLLNITNDHLDWHGNISHYLNSKLKIFNLQNQNQYAFLNKKIEKSFRKKNFFSKLIIPNIKNYKKLKSKLNNDYLLSNINDENMSFVYTFSKLLKIKDKNFIIAMKSFKGLPHRFETFFKKKGITFINDSKATSFKATESALSNLKNIYLILGGLPKRGDKIQLTKFKSKIIKCFLIGKNINFFKKQIKNIVNISETKNLKNTIIQILKECKLQKQKKKIVLLSPAAASFDQYSNFEHRGTEFKKLCIKYARKLI